METVYECEICGTVHRWVHEEVAPQIFKAPDFMCVNMHLPILMKVAMRRMTNLALTPTDTP